MDNLFYDSAISPETKDFILNEEESRHALKVLRMQTGDPLRVINGNGFLFHTVIKDTNTKRCPLEIISVEEVKRPEKEVHIAVAPTKNMDRIEWFVEKATEIGVTEITWLKCENSERRVIKNERVEKIAISALKQSKRLFLPKINELIGLPNFLKLHPKGAIAHCYEHQDKKNLKQVFQISDYPILIGPEGDFSLHELELIEKSNYDGITLGENRLRTETAALVACIQCVYL